MTRTMLDANKEEIKVGDKVTVLAKEYPSFVRGYGEGPFEIKCIQEGEIVVRPEGTIKYLYNYEFVKYTPPKPVQWV